MLQINDDISKVPQVGPKSKTLLNKLNIHKVEDLLYHFPFRYEDRSQMKEIADLEKGEKVTVKARVTSIQNIFTKNKKRITRGCAEDDTGEIQMIWFNMHFISKNIRVGETYLIHGTVELFEKKSTFIVPDMEEFGETNIHLGRIVPIYPTTEGISSKWVRSRINDLLSEMSDFDENKGLIEFLPEKIIDKHKFLPVNTAIKEIHFPRNFDLLEEARDRFAYEELFLDLSCRSLMEKKWNQEAKAFPMDDKGEEESLKNFIASLPFKLTEDQEKVTQEILEDLKMARPLNRLLEGDVGTGKTIVAIIASLHALNHGKNVMYMAPTEILAQQHYETFLKFLGPLGTDVRLVTSASKKKSRFEEENEGASYIQIGTHALLYTNQGRDNLGLVIIDEQHRFGVEQREQLLKSAIDGTTPHLLTMTATPIPRTLALTLYGDLDISILKEHPNKMRQIITRVVPTEKQSEIYEWISEKNLSAFVVCPFIEESVAENLENVKAATVEFNRLKSTVFKGKKCALLHGKTSLPEKEEVIEKFRSGQIQILVSTPVVEVGIDIPEADVMVIESAERYGLASLHQLRGRVGRGAKKGYCFVFPSVFSKKSYERLKNLEETLDGLKLAEIDLKLRGQGDIFGITQHGFMDFRLANINDLDFVRMVREDVNEITENIDNYPNLLNYIKRRKGDSTKN